MIAWREGGKSGDGEEKEESNEAKERGTGVEK